MSTKKENELDSKSSLVNADKLRIINSADSNDSESITYENLKTSLENDGIGGNPVSTYDPNGNYTILDDDGYTHIIDSSTGTITLPTLADNYDRIITIIRDVASSTTALIIDGEGAETIAGKTTEYIYGRYGVITLLASEDAGEWVFVGNPYDPYEIEYSSTSNVAADQPSTPAHDGWANPLNHQITLPIGYWDVFYDVTVDLNVSTASYYFWSTTLSTAQNTESDSKFSVTYYDDWSGRDDGYSPSTKTRYCYEASSSTTLYLNMRWQAGTSPTSTLNTLATRGSVGGTIIKARRCFP